MTEVTEVHHLNCAHLSRLRLDGRPLGCHVMLLATASSGLVLVDSGLGTADYAQIASRLGRAFAYAYASPSIDPALAAINQVRQLGFDPRDVRHIVQTHLDLDHVGGLSDFPWATVHVHDVELRSAFARKGFRGRGRYRPLMWAHHPRFESYRYCGEPWLGFAAVRDLRGLPPDILFVPLPGHTLGHCGVAVQTGQGWLLDAGDAYYDPREVHQARRQCELGLRLFQAVITTNKKLWFHHQDRLRTFVATYPDVQVFSAHDPGFGSFVPSTGQVSDRALLAEWPPTTAG